ncbi:MAG: hypothetical protein LBJ67_07390 [Planctomycetaceae bacterium]|jgi:hypothetical protein|nr:hypothetical protein [Planctomycetaceae bacterium]
MNNFIELKEIAENQWRAKYQGNYGVYTIKISLDEEGNRKDFSCSCPSDYSPCKHIAYVEAEIAEYKKKNEHEKHENALTVTQILKKISFNELRKFIVQYSKYNAELANAIILEFSHKMRKEHENPYADIIGKALKFYKIYEDDYSEDGWDIGPLDDWLEKAHTCLKEEKHEDAVLIAKACLEEFAKWFNKSNYEIEYFIDNYNQGPFEILHEVVKKTEIFNKDLYDYCKSKIEKTIYQKAEMSDCLNDLMVVVASQNDCDEFLAQQDDLLKDVSDKSSYAAKKILQRKIDFYKNIKQQKKAEEIIETNLQIEDFCQEAVKKRIARKKYAEAKTLIADFLKNKPSAHQQYWNEYILDIARKEQDIPVIRATAYEFIKSYFTPDYYAIYKSTFTPKEWQEEIERLIKRYEKDSRNYSYTNKAGFQKSIADLFVAEKLPERLIEYLEKHLSTEAMEEYYTVFSKQFPDKTLQLYRKAINEYAKNNLGREHYEYISKQLKKMQQMPNGNSVVTEMVANFRQIYKNRSAMMNVLKNYK